MERAGEFLGRAARRLKGAEAPLAWLSAVWPEIVGQGLASHTRPVRCHAGRLDLMADGEAWRQEINSAREEICLRINQGWGGSLVREVTVTAAKPEPARSYETDNNHTPFIRRRSAR
jgi:predicted nucleic acid-binding Zn ribbon protein